MAKSKSKIIIAQKPEKVTPVRIPLSLLQELSDFAASQPQFANMSRQKLVKTIITLYIEEHQTEDNQTEPNHG